MSQFWDFGVVWWKFTKFSIFNFLTNFASAFSAIMHNSSVTFLDQKSYTLVESIPLKCKFWDFRVFGSKFIKFIMSILNWQLNSSSSFASLFIVMRHNTPVNFTLIHLNSFFFSTLNIKSHRVPNFKTFECSGENLPNSSCHLRKHKSVFWKNLH